MVGSITLAASNAVSTILVLIILSESFVNAERSGFFGGEPTEKAGLVIGYRLLVIGYWLRRGMLMLRKNGVH